MNSGVIGESSSPAAIRYSVPHWRVKLAALKPSPGAGLTASDRPGSIAHESVRSIVSRMLPDVLFSSNILFAAPANICRVLPGWLAKISKAPRAAVKLYPLIHVQDRSAVHRSGPQQGHQRDVAFLLEPLQVPADTGHLEPASHPAGHDQVCRGRGDPRPATRGRRRRPAG